MLTDADCKTAMAAMAAVLESVKAGELLRAIDAYAGQPVTRAALAWAWPTTGPSSWSSAGP